jgi:signal transduction histidine kinase
LKLISQSFFTTLKHSADEKGIQFELLPNLALPTTIVCDPTRLKQIMMNITGNAIKFTSTGKVTVETLVLHNPERLSVSVTDIGEGIAECQLSRMFNPFTQADSSSTRKFGGTGLHLDISRRLARLLGGDVVVQSSI